ncbi:FdtA/QdtA family cupin domain-containing protein [Carboxylicivirga sp. M1479]|uniref:sugar 3,4-ketoisomerase n=1 Tax=Carboxylicivirga sp. M1479 TaxID=2594476 RepID=UPI0011780836|nr:FdtA/QdtA family cupin domain-containing protein [Carboxylicivirga sp. M1479]TRX72630.1 WxcM-like domain-containing protein [Carboxylicivirga sp. M1479]
MSELKDLYQLITLPKITDSRGNLSFIEENEHVPFDIKRVYYTYDIPSGAERGGHAHYEQHELLIALNGSLDVILDYRGEKQIISLNKPFNGLHIKPGIWHELTNFSCDCVLLALSSCKYDSADYISDYSQFIDR